MNFTSASGPQPTLAWQFESSNVDYVSGLTPSLSTAGTYAAPTGGTITTVAGKRIHSFTSVATTSITFRVPVTAEILVVAGGGGGGGTGTTNQTGGGGGGGELYYSASYTINPGTYTVTVGAGGTGGIGSTTGAGGGTPTSGGDSIFGTISCNGGGYGGSSGVADNGGSGGSGGGASRAATGGASVKTAAGFGNAGGSSAGSLAGGTAGGGGGGGAGGAGAAAGPDNNTRAAGGAGRAYSISGSSITYAIGGAGGSRNGNGNGTVGTTNRGNGGRGGDGSTSTNGGNGGSGIVIISYNNTLYPAPTYVTGKYGQAINFNNTLSPAGADPNCYVSYDVSSFALSSNSAAMSLWLNSGLTYPITAGPTPFYINLQGSSYNGLYTASATSSISFRTGEAPAVTVGTVPGQTGTWSHHCAVFSNVGADASNINTYYYVNGSLIGSANNKVQSFTALNLGCQNNDANGALCSIDDLRIYNTALSAAQIQSIYRAQGMPSRGVQSKSPIQPGYIYEPYNNYTIIGSPDVKVINSSNPDPRIYVDPTGSPYAQWSADPNLLTKWNLMPFTYYILLGTVFNGTATNGLRFPVYIPQTTTYNVKILVYGAGGNTDSLWIGMDSEAAIQLSFVNLTPTWITGLSSKSLSAGNHTLELYMREPYGIGGIMIVPTGGSDPTLLASRQYMFNS